MMNWNALLSPNRIGQSQSFGPGQARSPFEQDYDRIIFSHPFRRLQDKTQVHPLPEHDFVHTRLTHSLEVSSVGRSLGRQVGEVIIERHPDLKDKFSFVDFGAIVAAASLAHDIGNPPFGHAGESAISEFFRSDEYGKGFQKLVSAAQWEDLRNFEGNAQGFRLLNKNEFGLKLTSATLGAFTKYPCPALLPERDKEKRSQKKFGFYQSEREVFSEVARELQLAATSDYSWLRHPLAFLVEAADDICYSVIDLEDGCNLNLISYEEFLQLLKPLITRSQNKLGKLNTLNSREEKVGYLRALAIGDLTYECATIFLDNEHDILQGNFDMALSDVGPSKKHLNAIIDVSVTKIYQSRSVVEIEASGHEILPNLVAEFLKAGENLLSRNKQHRKYNNLTLLLPSNIAARLKDNQDVYTMVRLILDFISGLTDKYAVSLHRRIRGL